jgi:hypothetical protein
MQLLRALGNQVESVMITYVIGYNFHGLHVLTVCIQLDWLTLKGIIQPDDASGRECVVMSRLEIGSEEEFVTYTMIQQN